MRIRMKRNKNMQTVKHIKTVFQVMVAIALMLAGSGRAYAIDEFDHFTTGFPLTGLHEHVDCAECHIAGRFQGTPVECGLCHNNLIAEGKHPSHIISSDFCDDCHTDLSWSNAIFEHSEIFSPCQTCHNNVTATGLPPGHINSTNDCEDCHNTISFDRVTRVDHNAVLGSCSSCHNGVIATGKHPQHIATNAECDDCHNTSNWDNARFDHSGITAACSSCHDGITATGKHPQHLVTTAECDFCHTTSSWGNIIFDHSSVTGSCDSCHNGTTATGKPAGHFITSLDCELCHTTADWLPLTMYSHTSGSYPGDHQPSVGCTDCHTGNSETINWPSPSYVPECAACHENDFEADEHKVTNLITNPEFWDCSGSCHIDGQLENSEHRPGASEW